MIKGGWYSRIIHLGNRDGYPIFTFTGGWDDEDIRTTEPGEAYIRTIIMGLNETYPGMSHGEIMNYFNESTGYVDSK